MLFLTQVFWKNLCIFYQADQFLVITKHNWWQLKVFKTSHKSDLKLYRFDYPMDHFVINKRHIPHLFTDHKEMSAGDIVMEVVSWNSNIFRNNPVETRNQKMTLFNHMKWQIKSKYDT